MSYKEGCTILMYVRTLSCFAMVPMVRSRLIRKSGGVIGMNVLSVVRPLLPMLGLVVRESDFGSRWWPFVRALSPSYLCWRGCWARVARCL